MIVEGSGRVADVIAQVANLPVAKITIALIQKKLSVLFHDTYEFFTESKLVEWTKKVSPLLAPLSFGRPKRSHRSWLMSTKDPSGKFKPHLPPSHPHECPGGHLKGSGSAPPLLAPFGQRGRVCDQPMMEDTAQGLCRCQRGVRNCPAQCWGLGSSREEMLLLIARPRISLQIQDIVRSRQLLTIFREGKCGQQDVDVAILQALFKGEGWGPPWEDGAR